MSENIDVNTQLKCAEKILCELLNVGVSDLYAIYEMEQAHPGTLDRTFELFDEFNEKPNFGFFVMAVRDVALDEVRDVITKEDAESFQDLLLDDGYAYWGPIMEYGYYEGEDAEANHKRQELFGEYVRGKITRDAFVKRYAELLKAQGAKQQVGENRV
jgi:alpha-amylase/alpha-mannosidase (GH57 family)